MFHQASLRQGVGLLALAALMILTSVHFSGCSSDDTTAPTAPTASAPQLPDPERLNFDFQFFAENQDADKLGHPHHANFLNAYFRVVIIDALATLSLAPPVAVFSVALHTIPSLQDDGAWIWVYTAVDGDQETQVRLKGLPLDNEVQWELRVTADHHNPPLDNAVWFHGTTSNQGAKGRWFFNDLDLTDMPQVAEIIWDEESAGRFLTFISHEADSNGDTLRFTDADPRYVIDFTRAATQEHWFIRWQADGSGSLQVPDYNEGLEACWDEDQIDIVCR